MVALRRSSKYQKQRRICTSGSELTGTERVDLPAPSARWATVEYARNSQILVGRVASGSSTVGSLEDDHNPPKPPPPSYQYRPLDFDSYEIRILTFDSEPSERTKIALLYGARFSN